MASHRTAQIRRASVVVVFGLLTLAPPLASRWMGPITSAVSLEGCSPRVCLAARQVSAQRPVSNPVDDFVILCDIPV